MVDDRDEVPLEVPGVGRRVERGVPTHEQLVRLPWPVQSRAQPTPVLHDDEGVGPESKWVEGLLCGLGGTKEVGPGGAATVERVTEYRDEIEPVGEAVVDAQRSRYETLSVSSPSLGIGSGGRRGTVV